ncbi:MAG: serine/threonine-protein kinase [Myxococcales bacterium]|nr:serine/threonine-protein kinase [Myxococcales bacterium]
MSLAGARIRDYEVWGRLGQGGMSELWLAKQTVLNLPVVIKTLRRDSAGLDSTGVARLLNEARVMVRITSSKVVRALDAGVHEGTPYVVLEYVDGLDLAELDARRRASLGVGLPLWFCAHVMGQVCLALHASHQTGILHRDVKPSNVFGGAETGIRLGDFGIAVPHLDVESMRDISGTFRFMPPEQMRGEPLDRAADIYAAGATAFDLRYGSPPFLTIDEVLDLRNDPPFPEPEGPHEAYFQHVVGHMLEKVPGKRPKDTHDLARHFRSIDQALRPHRRVAFLRQSKAPGRHAFQVGTCRVEIETGDLAQQEVDGIVNSAHDHLRMDGGCGAALRAVGGMGVEEEALAHGQQALGACVATSAGKLRARKVLHAVSAWNEISCVARAAHRTLLLADELGLRSLAIPALGTGAARVSVETCANAIATTLRWHLMLGGTGLSRVKFVLRDASTTERFAEVVEQALRGDRAAGPALDIGRPAVLEAQPEAPTQVETDPDDGVDR